MFAGLGAAVGLLAWLPVYLMRWIEPGDVSSWQRWVPGLELSACCVRLSRASSPAGSLNLAMLLWRRPSRDATSRMVLVVNTIRRKPTNLLILRSALATAEERAMPYGVALVAGALATGWLSSAF